MVSKTFCCWDKQQSADSNIFHFQLTLKCTKDQSSHFCDCFLASKWIFQKHDRSLTKFHGGTEQLLVCVVINNSGYPVVKNNNTAYHAFGKYWMQARGFLNYRLKYCWPKVFYCICQPNELEREIMNKKLGVQAKIWGAMAHPRPPLESPLLSGAAALTPVLLPCHQRRHANCDWISASYTSGQSSYLRGHLNC